jgi:hypothetical protein
MSEREATRAILALSGFGLAFVFIAMTLIGAPL